MAKTLVTLDRNLVNYDNIVFITIEQGEYTDEEENTVSNVYGLIAVDTGNNIHVLGAYEDTFQAAQAIEKLKKWLERESHGVYDFEGDN